MPTWLSQWQPEDPQFWKEKGRKLAWRDDYVAWTKHVSERVDIA